MSKIKQLREEVQLLIGKEPRIEIVLDDLENSINKNHLKGLKNDLYTLIGNEDLTPDDLWDAIDGLLVNIYDYLLKLDKEL